MNDTDLKPVIGLPACVKQLEGTPFHSVGDKYLRAVVEAAQAIPMVIPAFGHGRIVAVAGDVAGKPGPPFPLASPARCGMARGSGPWWSTCRTTSSCPKIVWPS